jgi:hypothetical protein
MNLGHYSLMEDAQRTKLRILDEAIQSNLEGVRVPLSISISRGYRRPEGLGYSLGVIVASKAMPKKTLFWAGS